MRRAAGIGLPNDSAHIAGPLGRSRSSSFRILESTLDIGNLPRQTGVYAARRLGHLDRPSEPRACEAMSLRRAVVLLHGRPGR
jgi:hypothetical protein